MNDLDKTIAGYGKKVFTGLWQKCYKTKWFIDKIVNKLKKAGNRSL